ncbi:MAG TPA: DUF2721 domain-containing protein [Candidatus Thermoplasmatota archaeon]|nr:DUF2721 domain-containing protein [Candidatus Thermoplasmatota archaeon]
MVLPPAVEVIQATLAPAFMISGTSVFLNFAQNRLFRVMDRTRSKDPAMQEEAGGRTRLRRRAHILRNAIAFGVLTVGLTIASAILVMASELFGLAKLANMAPYTFALALLSFFGALLFVFYDTLLSVRSVESRR